MMHERDARKKFPFMCKNLETNAKMKSKIVILLFLSVVMDPFLPSSDTKHGKVSYGERDVLYIY